MSVESVLAAGREAALSLMLDTGVITRGGGDPVWDPALGTYTPASPTTVYDGPCRVKPWLAGQEVQAGEREVALRSYQVQLPWDTPERVEVGDVFTVTASGDGWLIGRPMPVAAAEVGTSRTARWITVENQDG